MKEIALRGRTFPNDLNPEGNAFGGWIMSEMDKAASIAVENIIISPAVTVSVSNLHFVAPVKNGDIFTIYTKIDAIGNTSIKIYVEFMVKCKESKKKYIVTDGIFTFVAIGNNKKPVNIKDVLRDDIPIYIKNLLQ